MDDNATEEQLDACLNIAVAAGVVMVCRKHGQPFYYGGSRSTLEAFKHYGDHKVEFPQTFSSDAQAIRFIGAMLANLELSSECFKCNEGSHPFRVA